MKIILMAIAITIYCCGCVESNRIHEIPHGSYYSDTQDEYLAVKPNGLVYFHIPALDGKTYIDKEYNCRLTPNSKTGELLLWLQPPIASNEFFWVMGAIDIYWDGEGFIVENVKTKLKKYYKR